MTQGTLRGMAWILDRLTAAGRARRKNRRGERQLADELVGTIAAAGDGWTPGELRHLGDRAVVVSWQPPDVAQLQASQPLERTADGKPENPPLQLRRRRGLTARRNRVRDVRCAPLALYRLAFDPYREGRALTRRQVPGVAQAIVLTTAPLVAIPFFAAAVAGLVIGG